MNKVILISNKINSNNKLNNMIIKNNCLDTSDEIIYLVEDSDEIFGMKLKNSETKIKYSSREFDIIINRKIKVAVISYLKHDRFIFHNKILDLINTLHVENLSIFNYSFCIGCISSLTCIKKLDLIGNLNAIYGHTKCNIPNNLTKNLEYLQITSPPNDIKKILYFPNKLQTLSINFIMNYFPSSLIRLICNNEKYTNLTFILFPNKIQKLELSNNFINNSLIIPAVPINVQYILIRINGNFLNSRKKRVFNNFIFTKSALQNLHIFDCD